MYPYTNHLVGADPCHLIHRIRRSRLHRFHRIDSTNHHWRLVAKNPLLLVHHRLRRRSHLIEVVSCWIEIGHFPTLGSQDHDTVHSVPASNHYSIRASLSFYLIVSPFDFDFDGSCVLPCLLGLWWWHSYSSSLAGLFWRNLLVFVIFRCCFICYYFDFSRSSLPVLTWSGHRIQSNWGTGSMAW